MDYSKIKLRSVLLFVENIKKSRDFYRSLFEMEPIEDLENFVSFEILGTYFNLHLADTKSPLSTGGCVGYYEVSSLQIILERAISLGAKIWRGPLKVNKNWSIVQIKDPFGNVVGFEGENDIQ